MSSESLMSEKSDVVFASIDADEGQLNYVEDLENIEGNQAVECNDDETSEIIAVVEEANNSKE